MTKELAISTHGLTKQFDRRIVVNDVDLQVEAGEVYGLIGPNGAGKTTLIRMLTIAEEPSAGEIYLFGEKLLRDRSQPNLKRQIGYLPDDFPLYEDLSVWDYLDYFARLYHLRNPHRHRRLHEVLELVHLGPKRHSRTSSLSRGMKQRLSLARTIIHEPLLLLLDEPVSGLDPIARMQFRDIIKTLQAAGMTILISSHVLSDLAELCSSVGIMELGFLVESASLQDIYRRLSRPQILLSTLGKPEQLLQALQKHPWVEEGQVLPNQQVQIYFTGTPADQAKLLRSLIEDHIPICEFRCTQDNLESIFLNKLDHQQAS